MIYKIKKNKFNSLRIKLDTKVGKKTSIRENSMLPNIWTHSHIEFNHWYSRSHKLCEKALNLLLTKRMKWKKKERKQQQQKNRIEVHIQRIMYVSRHLKHNTSSMKRSWIIFGRINLHKDKYLKSWLAHTHTTTTAANTQKPNKTHNML